MNQGSSESKHLFTNPQDAVTLSVCILWIHCACSQSSLLSYKQDREQRANMLWMTVWKMDISLGLAGAGRQHRYTLHTHLV